MNLSQFKKIKQTKTHTVLKDQNGHEIRIAHSALPHEMRMKLEGVPMYAGGTDKVEAPDSPDSNSQDAAQPDKNVVVNVNPPAQGQPEQKPLYEGQFSPMSSLPAQTQAPEVPNVKATPTGNELYEDKTANVTQAVQNLQKAEQDAAKLEGARAKATTDTLQAAQNFQQQKMDEGKESLARMQLITQHMDEYQNKNPERANAYLEDMPAPQKVITAIGLVLGGIAGRGHGNVAMDFLKDQINRNIDAQKTNIENKKSVYGFYHQLYGDDVAARNAALIQGNDWLKHQLELSAAKMGTAAAQVNANKRGAELTLQNAQLINENAARTGSYTSGQGGKILGANTPQQPAGVQTASAAQPHGASGSWGEGEEQPTPVAYKPMLKPNALEAARGLRGMKLVNQDKLDKQLTLGDQADKLRANLHEIYQNLGKNASWTSRLNAGISPHALGAIGGAGGAAIAGLPGAGMGAGLGEGIGHLLQTFTNTEGVRSYQLDKQRLENEIRAVLPHVSKEEIHDTVEAYAIQAGDGPELRKKKEESMQKFLDQNQQTDELKVNRLLNGT